MNGESQSFSQEAQRLYGEEFYRWQIPTAFRSAHKYLDHLWTQYQPQSILDVGCGRGVWLAACHQLGAVDLFGVDGDWNSQSKMIDPAIHFQNADLNEPIVLRRKFDLAICLEVAEHLRADSSHAIVSSLTHAADVILFSAAFPGQGGTGHINERPHSYWGVQFRDRGFGIFDMFRPAFWADTEVSFWYRQNAFLFVKRDCDLYGRLIDARIHELTQIGFMDCIHPELFLQQRPAAFKYHLRRFHHAFLRAVKGRN